MNTASSMGMTYEVIFFEREEDVSVRLNDFLDDLWIGRHVDVGVDHDVEDLVDTSVAARLNNCCIFD